MATFGEFVNAVEQIDSIDGQAFIADWKAIATDEEWEEYRPMELSQDLVIIFAVYIVMFFRERIAGIDVDELYGETIKDGHAFLQEVHAKAVELGVEVELNQIDVPLVPSESIVASG